MLATTTISHRGLALPGMFSATAGRPFAGVLGCTMTRSKTFSNRSTTLLSYRRCRFRVPPFPFGFSGPLAPALPTATVLAQDMKVPTRTQFNVSVQRQIRNTVFTIAYVGSEAYHLTRKGDLNEVVPTFPAPPQARLEATSFSHGPTRTACLGLIQLPEHRCHLLVSRRRFIRVAAVSRWLALQGWIHMVQNDRLCQCHRLRSRARQHNLCDGRK